MDNSCLLIHANAIFKKSLSSFSIICLLDSVFRPFRAIIFISLMPGTEFFLCLKYSRISRFILLRATAFPTFLDTVIPMRLCLPVPSRTAAIKKPVRIFFPCFESVKNWLLFRSRISLGKEKLFNTSVDKLYRGQSFSAFGPPGVDDPSSAGCRHSFQKSVFSGSFPVARLKCPFHKILILKLFLGFMANG